MVATASSTSAIRVATAVSTGVSDVEATDFSVSTVEVLREGLLERTVGLVLIAGAALVLLGVTGVPPPLRCGCCCGSTVEELSDDLLERLDGSFEWR